MCASVVTLAVAGQARAQADSAQADVSVPAGEVPPPMAADGAAPATTGGETEAFQGVEDIIVTANKRAETVNKVGMSITALGGDTLVKKGITVPSELVKVVPGLTFTEAPRGAPVFAIRGIGFDDSTLGSASTVALYIDEVPLGYPVQARFAALDLERVEILKGPQGILFGQNSTAGAINFIAAKPTDTFKGGFDISAGRFKSFEARAFVSGPISDAIRVRLSGMTVQSDAWQKSYTRNDELGDKRQYAGRFIAEVTPTEALTLTLNLHGWVDRSDTQAVQLFEVLPLLPVSQAANPGWVYPDYPRAPRSARAADWDRSPDRPLRRDDWYFQGSLRLDYKIDDNLRFTSITAYSRYKQEFALDVDGSALQDFLISDKGRIRTFNQELRLSGDYGALKFIIGGNYSKDKIHQENGYFLRDSSVFFGFLGNTSAGSFFDLPVRNQAVFGNIDYSINDIITLHGGIRYTEDKRTYTGCTTDAGNGVQGGIFNIIYPLFNPPGAPFRPIQPGECTSSNVVTTPSLVTPANPRGEYFEPGLAVYRLDENNVSWRAGVDVQATPTTLLYANVSKGYKSGSFPSVNVVNNIQLEGVKQESVLAIEGGVKAGLFDRKVQLNAAVFYNSYKNKQLRGRILDPFGFFGILDKLLNVPKSRVYGAEASIQIAPVSGLSINLGGTYVNTKVTKDFFAYDPIQELINYKGLPFPHTPKWMLNASIDYEFSITNEINLFIGGNAQYRSKAISLFADRDILETEFLDPVNRPGVRVPRNAFDEKAYTIVDAQIGIADPGGAWRTWLWGKNIFNTYYWSNSTQSFDSIYRIAAMPATYGVSASFRF